MKKLLGILGGLLLAAALGVAGYLWNLDRQITAFSAQPAGSGTVTVNIPHGTGPHSLAKLLAEAGVVSDGELFFRYLRRDKLAPKLRSGEYEFALPLTPQAITGKLISGEVKSYWFTVPEGLRVDEILPILAGSELTLSLSKLQALVSDPAFLKKQGIPAKTAEGFLFPDTYSFPRGADEAAVLGRMISRTLDAYQKADSQRQPGIQLNLLETITLASIVEKETGVPEERPRISCVFHNRLRQKIKLQTDPTVLYAMMLLRGSFIKNITKKDLETDHPYNTYTQLGLPPGPIANPGAAAISAALNPLSCQDLFFVSRNNGTHIFCPDLRCHEAAVEEWQKRFFQKQRQSARYSDKGEPKPVKRTNR